MAPRAILSVWDKTGLPALARGLVAHGFELIASGGTARALREADLPVTEVAVVTGSPEVLGGRVKTLHPAIHAGILSRRTESDDAELARQGIAPIDVVVCNLYPFFDEPSVEQIDIGGVTLVRAAAKNFEHVSVVTHPARYDALLSALAEGGPDLALRRSLAAEAFALTARYDLAIAGWTAGEADAGATKTLALRRFSALRYGENPHQSAALWTEIGTAPDFTQRSGETALSYNNLVDMDAARAIVGDFARPTVAIVKHTNPCGCASAATTSEAFVAALASDPVSAFGSIVAVNREVDEAFVEALGKLFVEVIVAPGYTEGAAERLAARKARTRVIEAPIPAAARPWELRGIQGAWLAQTPDVGTDDPHEWRVVTKAGPDDADLAALAFAWTVAKHVKSNAIVLAQGEATVGVGAGQMSRVDAVGLAARRAGDRAQGAVLASDAFFPFPDGIEAAAAAGVRAIVQPGGSMRDAECVAAADALGVAMLVTGRRHFKH